MEINHERYKKHQSMICVVNVFIFILGVAIYTLDFAQYANVIYNET